MVTIGIRGGISRNTLANGNKVRDWHIYADFSQELMKIARDLYVNEAFSVDLDNTVYAFDSSTVDLCFSLFSWAPFRRAKAAVKLHTLLDRRGNMPTSLHISDGNLHDVNALDLLVLEAGAFYIMDRGYLDFRRIYRFALAAAFFGTRAKSNTKMRRVCSEPVDKETGRVVQRNSIFHIATPHDYRAAATSTMAGQGLVCGCRTTRR